MIPFNNRILKSAYDNTSIQFALQKKFKGSMEEEVKAKKIKKFHDFLKRKVEKWKNQIKEQQEKEEQE